MAHDAASSPPPALSEFTVRAIVLGVAQAVVLGAANAYLGMKAGQTIAATFPAAVVSMLVLRGFRNSSILEENVSRTAGSVGEALVAGAIFTLPAFVIAGLWSEFRYWESTAMMLVGGTLGVLFVIFLRRTLVADPGLPFPEAVAAAEIHKAGQRGAAGGQYLFGSMAFAGLVEILKNPAGLSAIRDSVSGFRSFDASRVAFLRGGQTLGEPGVFRGGLHYETPYASPAFLAVGYIIGPRLAALNFSGGVLAWLVMVPLIMFISGPDSALVSVTNDPSVAGLPAAEQLDVVADQAWRAIVRPIAVGAMLVSAVWTLFRMRRPLVDGLRRALSDVRQSRGADARIVRTELDISPRVVIVSTGLLLVPMAALFAYYTGGIAGAVTAAVAMTFAGFMFSAVAGYLVGVIGSSASPVSGLALSSLIIAAVMLVGIGVTGAGGVLAVLAVATVVCCATCIAGGIIQDLKVGHILGGTPRAMQVAEIIAVVATSFVLVLPIAWLHSADLKLGGTGIGGENLPAPQASLMAMLAQGIVAGDMAWPLLLMGVALALGLIMLGCPSPMVVAVGMYLDFATSSAMFVGGAMQWIAERRLAARGYGPVEVERRTNIGTLLASGMIAGEALTAIILAILVNLNVRLPQVSASGTAGLVVFGLVAVILIVVPLRSRGESGE
jgi:putative OPT family oligopeptide transporter